MYHDLPRSARFWPFLVAIVDFRPGTIVDIRYLPFPVLNASLTSRRPNDHSWMIAETLPATICLTSQSVTQEVR
jgi:hypothetical protein